MIALSVLRQNTNVHQKGGTISMNKQINNEKGFTIIEVVLVLAIAGLIFLMVFIALPALQRNQRDTQRRNDLSRAQTAVNNYQSNNRGSLPTAAGATSWNNALRDRYLQAGGDDFTDPTGKAYNFTTAAMPTNPPSPADAPDDVNIFVSVGAVCNGEALTTGQGNRKVALRMKLEGGGIACVNN
jgi:prepilin-type N-terminal cleavage/methylation domain-containing protein